MAQAELAVSGEGISEPYKQSKERKVIAALNCDLTKAYANLLNYVVPNFDKINRQLQTGNPVVHKLRRMLLAHYKSILVKFIKPTCFNVSDDILSIDVCCCNNQKNDEELLVGNETFEIVSKLSDDQRKTFTVM